MNDNRTEFRSIAQLNEKVFKTKRNETERRTLSIFDVFLCNGSVRVESVKLVIVGAGASGCSM